MASILYAGPPKSDRVTSESPLSDDQQIHVGCTPATIAMGRVEKLG